MYMDVCAVLFSVIVVGVLGQTVEQPELSWIKSQNKRARINCIVTGLQSNNYVHWYQQKDGEALKRILYVNKGGTSPVYNDNVREATDFTVQLENDNYALRLLGATHFAEPLIIDLAHRVLQPKPPEGAKPSTIIARVHFYTEKKRILRLRVGRNLDYNGHKVYIFPDYTAVS
ncbi:hypothetical protein SRHO_G00021410 [Serrasalmus rhombeus]